MVVHEPNNVAVARDVFDMGVTKGGDLSFNTVDSLYPGCLRSTYVAMVPAGTAPTSGPLCFGATTEWPGATFYSHLWTKNPAARGAVTCVRGEQRSV